MLGALLLFCGFLITIRRASWLPLTTGPPTNTSSPADRALLVALVPSWRTTESLTSVQFQVVPSLARTTTSWPETDWIVPRSNASVLGPALVSKVNWPSMPPSLRSRTIAARACRVWVAAALAVVPLLPLAVVVGVAAVVSASFSTAAWPVGPPVAAAAGLLLSIVTAPKAAPPTSTAAATPPATSRPRLVVAAGRRGWRCAGRFRLVSGVHVVVVHVTQIARRVWEVGSLSLGIRRELAPRLGRMITMEFGVAIFPTHDAIRPGDVARLAEERGHESLFFPEHTHIPVEHSPYPGGGPLPYRYVHTFDLFVALTAAASATSRLRIGSGVCLVIERDPITTAKETASVDYLSGGRFEFGVGAGWNREEMANHGTDPRTRMAVMRERVEAIKAIWTTDEASYAGEYVNFDRIWSWPKPAQRPHPPVIVGGEGPTVLDRVLAFGDAWMPNHGPSDLIKRSAELRLRADRHISLQVMGVPADPAVFEAYAAEEFDRVVHWLPSAGRGPVERALDAYESAILEFTGG